MSAGEWGCCARDVIPRVKIDDTIAEKEYDSSGLRARTSFEHILKF